MTDSETREGATIRCGVVDSFRDRSKQCRCMKAMGHDGPHMFSPQDPGEILAPASPPSPAAAPAQPLIFRLMEMMTEAMPELSVLSTPEAQLRHLLARARTLQGELEEMRERLAERLALCKDRVEAADREKDKINSAYHGGEIAALNFALGKFAPVRRLERPTDPPPPPRGGMFA